MRFSLMKSFVSVFWRSFIEEVRDITRDSVSSSVPAGSYSKRVEKVKVPGGSFSPLLTLRWLLVVRDVKDVKFECWVLPESDSGYIPSSDYEKVPVECLPDKLPGALYGYLVFPGKPGDSDSDLDLDLEFSTINESRFVNVVGGGIVCEDMIESAFGFFGDDVQALALGLVFVQPPAGSGIQSDDEDDHDDDDTSDQPKSNISTPEVFLHPLTLYWLGVYFVLLSINVYWFTTGNLRGFLWIICLWSGRRFNPEWWLENLYFG